MAGDVEKRSVIISKRKSMMQALEWLERRSIANRKRSFSIIHRSTFVHVSLEIDRQRKREREFGVP